MTDFVHLHLHSQYSLLDGANRLDDVVAAAAQVREERGTRTKRVDGRLVESQ